MPTGVRVLEEILRQLQDPTSHMRRKSAFGALVTQGASMRYISDEVVEVDVKDAARSSCTEVGTDCGTEALEQSSSGRAKGSEIPKCAAETFAGVRLGSAESRIQGPRSKPSGRRCPSPWRSAGAGGRPHVPHIRSFPQAQLPKEDGTMSSEWLASWFDWLPSACTPSHCCSAPQKGSCKILVKDPRNPLDEVPKALLSNPWPLCLPQAAVAFPGTSHIFSRVALEVDHDELAVITVPHRQRSVPSSVSTPSTACTSGCGGDSPDPSRASRPLTAHEAPSPSTSPKHGPSRLVLSRSSMIHTRRWPPSEVEHHCSRVSTEDRPPWPHIVEIRSLQGEGPSIILLSVPSCSIASAVLEALSAGSYATVSFDEERQRERKAVRCELRIFAKIDIRSDDRAANCSAVVCRGICDALRIGADRVRVVGVYDEIGETADVIAFQSDEDWKGEFRLVEQNSLARSAVAGVEISVCPPGAVGHGL